MPDSTESRALLLQINATTEKLRSELSAAEQAMGRFQGATESKLVSLDEAFAKLGEGSAKAFEKITAFAGINVAGFVAGLAEGALVEHAKGALEYAASLGGVSKQLGVTTRDLQLYRYAAGQTEVSQEEMDKGLSKLTLSLGRAQAGASEPIKAFAALGLSLDQLRGKSAGDVIPLIADALARLPSPAQRAAVEVALFGKTGQQLEPLLSQGGAAIAGMTGEYERLGGVLSDRVIEQSEQAAHKLAQVKDVLNSQFARAVGENAGQIEGLGQAFENALPHVVKFFNEMIGGANLIRQDGLLRYVLEPGSPNVNALASTPRGLATVDRARMDAQTSRLVDLKRKGADPLAIDDQTRRVLAARATFWNALAQIPKEAPEGEAKPTATLPPFLGGGGSGRTREARGKSAADLAQEQARNQASFDREYQSANQRLADTTAELANTADARLAVELQRADDAKAARFKEIADELKEGRIDQVQAVALRIDADQQQVADRQLATRRASEQLQQQQLGRQQAQLQGDIELLQAQESLATTAAARRDLELQILAKEEALAKLPFQTTLADPNASDDQKKDATAGIGRIDAQHGAKVAGVAQQTQNPLQSYLSSLPKTGEQMNEALEGVAANGLKSVTDGLTGLITGTEKASQAFKQMASETIADTARIIMEKPL